jgi:hypothetical protein
MDRYVPEAGGGVPGGMEATENCGVRVQIVRMNAWLAVRAAVLLSGMPGASSFIPGPESPFSGGSIMLLLMFFGFGVVAMIFVVGLQAINPRSAAVWTRPNWSVNPFSLKQPLQFFHMTGFYFIVVGLGGDRADTAQA